MNAKSSFHCLDILFMQFTLFWQSLSCILESPLSSLNLTLHWADGRSQIREINLSAMDVCRTNKLFLMRQFGLSQSNFAVKKRDQMYCKIEFFQIEYF